MAEFLLRSDGTGKILLVNNVDRLLLSRAEAAASNAPWTVQEQAIFVAGTQQSEVFTSGAEAADISA